MTAASGNAGKRRVTFTLEAPQAKEVALCGSFNNWDKTKTPLKRERNGAWKARVMLPPGNHEYRLWVDGEWADDPNAEAHVPNPFGSRNCVRRVAAGG